MAAKTNRKANGIAKKNGALRVLVVGVGNMGASHARAYDKIEGFELAGLCARRIAKRTDLPARWSNVPRFADYGEALETLKPDVVSINTWPDTHADYAIRAFKAGAHVFMEKPIAETVKDAKRVVATARDADKKLVIGYILRVHPSWVKFVELAKGLGKPLVMRMNLNQQSIGDAWTWHKNLMKSLPPIVDCGVHYVDVMCQMTGAKPVHVHGIGAHLTKEVKTYNYGHLHVEFDDGSVGWYEAGWGPMMSETALFVKDMVGPKGSVSMVADDSASASSASHDAHTRTNALRLHHGALSADGTFAKPDELINTAQEPGHQELCDLEQAAFLDAIRAKRDLSGHHEDALNSLRIVFAADESMRSGEAVRLEG